MTPSLSIHAQRNPLVQLSPLQFGLSRHSAPDLIRSSITTTAIRLAFIFDSPTDIANTLLLLATTTYFRSTTTITSSDIFIKHRTDLNRFLNLSLLGSTFNHHLLYFFNFYILDNQFINRHCFCFHKKRFKCLLNLIIRR